MKLHICRNDELMQRLARLFYLETDQNTHDPGAIDAGAFPQNHRRFSLAQSHLCVHTLLFVNVAGSQNTT